MEEQGGRGVEVETHLRSMLEVHVPEPNVPNTDCHEELAVIAEGDSVYLKRERKHKTELDLA